MAKRSSGKTSTALVRATTSSRPQPIAIRVSAPRASSGTTHKKPKHGGKRRHALSSVALTEKTLTAAAIGGALLGFIDKSFPNLPTLPVIGRAGTITLIAYMIGKRGGGAGGMGSIARDVALAGAAITGYELGKEGKVTGDVARQVGGVAAQV